MLRNLRMLLAAIILGSLAVGFGLGFLAHALVARDRAASPSETSPRPPEHVPPADPPGRPAAQ